MAFIFPVNNYQYQQYQDRMKEIKRINNRPIGIEKVKKAYLLPKDFLFNAKPSADKVYRKRLINKADEIYTQLTGKGKFFNEMI